MQAEERQQGGCLQLQTVLLQLLSLLLRWQRGELQLLLARRQQRRRREPEGRRGRQLASSARQLRPEQRAGHLCCCLPSWCCRLCVDQHRCHGCCLRLLPALLSLQVWPMLLRLLSKGLLLLLAGRLCIFKIQHHTFQIQISVCLGSCCSWRRGAVPGCS